MTYQPEIGILEEDTWIVAEAKAKFSRLIDRAGSRGPQTINRRGRKAVVVVSAEEWERKTGRQGSLADFLAASPLRDSKIEAERMNDGPRSRVS